MDPNKELKFNLYNILVIPLEETINEMSYLYKGKINEPNVMVIENGDMTPFVCEKLVVKKTQNPEIVILCKNIVNYENPMYLHIPLVYNGFSEPNIIDTLLRSSMKQELEINLNELLENDNVTYGSHKNENHYYFQTPLLIQTKMNQHIIEGMAEDKHSTVGLDHANDKSTLKLFEHISDDTVDGGTSIHLKGEQEMICTETDGVIEEDDWRPDENYEKHIYTALATSFFGVAGFWYASHKYILNNWKFIHDYYEWCSKNSIIIRLGLLIIAGMFLGLGGGYGSKNPSLEEKRGAISFMVFAGLFFALGVMPVNFDVDTNNNLTVKPQSDAEAEAERQRLAQLEAERVAAEEKLAEMAAAKKAKADKKAVEDAYLHPKEAADDAKKAEEAKAADAAKKAKEDKKAAKKPFWKIKRFKPTAAVDKFLKVIGKGSDKAISEGDQNAMNEEEIG